MNQTATNLQYEFATPEPVSVQLEVGVGSVTVHASERIETSVEVQPRDAGKDADLAAAAATAVEFDGQHLLIRAPRTWRRFTPINDGAIDVTIELPAGSHLRGHTDLGALTGDGQLGRCEFRSGMGRITLDCVETLDVKSAFGDVTVGACLGTANVVASSGRIQVGRIDGSARIKNSNGETRVGFLGARSEVRSANGNVDIETATHAVDAKTSNGSVRIGEVSGGRVEVRSSCGDIEVGVRSGVAAWLELNTRNGMVRNGLTEGEPEEPTTETVEVHASTSYGDIVVKRVSD